MISREYIEDIAKLHEQINSAIRYALTECRRLVDETKTLQAKFDEATAGNEDIDDLLNRRNIEVVNCDFCNRLIADDESDDCPYCHCNEAKTDAERRSEGQREARERDGENAHRER